MVRKYDYAEAENTNTQSRFQHNSIQHDLISRCQCQRLQTGTGAAGWVLEMTQPGTATTVVSSTPKGTQM